MGGVGLGGAAVSGNRIPGGGSASRVEPGPGPGPALGGAGCVGPTRVPETEGTSEGREQGRPAHL